MPLSDYNSTFNLAYLVRLLIRELKLGPFLRKEEILGRIHDLIKDGITNKNNLFLENFLSENGLQEVETLMSNDYNMIRTRAKQIKDLITEIKAQESSEDKTNMIISE